MLARAEKDTAGIETRLPRRRGHCHVRGAAPWSCEGVGRWGGGTCGSRGVWLLVESTIGSATSLEYRTQSDDSSGHTGSRSIKVQTVNRF